MHESMDVEGKTFALKRPLKRNLVGCREEIDADAILAELPMQSVVLDFSLNAEIFADQLHLCFEALGAVHAFLGAFPLKVFYDGSDFPPVFSAGFVLVVSSLVWS